LETSKEELQSVNEELATINTELQTKVTDLSRVNNDMNNLLAGTGIATIFLDLSLRILRFTPTAIKIINLIPTDVGRPVAHVVSNLIGYTTLVDDLQEVLDSLIQKQVEVQIRDDKWYTMRIQPYRTLENVIEGAVITFSEITERRIAEQKVNELLEKNEILLREVHHRIKNHMASVFSLLSLQSTNANEALVATALRDAANRVQSMMVLYDQLNQSKNLDKISAKKYLTTLVDQILGNSQIASWIKIEKNIMDFELDVNRLQSLGLIVNELLTNTVKYAFKNRQDGFIKIETLVVDQTAFVSVEDNGNGISDSIDFESSTGFGLKLVKMLSKHLSGKIAIIRNKGTKITIEFHL
jgi:two-component sensor histidine kinase